MNSTKRFFDYFFEIIGWIQIAVSPILIGITLSLVCLYYLEGAIAIVIAILCILLGVSIGVIWASKIYKSKKGTLKYVSEVYDSPGNELND